jgi:hypothetical protein
VGATLVPLRAYAVLCNDIKTMWQLGDSCTVCLMVTAVQAFLLACEVNVSFVYWAFFCLQLVVSCSLPKVQVCASWLYNTTDIAIISGYNQCSVKKTFELFIFNFKTLFLLTKFSF